MAPETWAGLAVIGGAVARHLGGMAWDRRKNGHGNGNGLGKLEWRVGQLETLTGRLEEKLDGISGQISDLRVEIAERE